MGSAMSEQEQTDAGVRLLRSGGSDEEVERLTGMSLLQIIELRADAAAAPAALGAAEARRRSALKILAAPLAISTSIP